MNLWKRIFGNQKTNTVDLGKNKGVVTTQKENRHRGSMEYALVVTSLPEEPPMEHLVPFVQESLPDLGGDTKIGFVWKTDPIDSIDIPALAVQAFGEHVSDETQFIYRTIGFQLEKGHAKILVIYARH